LHKPAARTAGILPPWVTPAPVVDAMRMRTLTRLAYLVLLLTIGTRSVGMTQSVPTDRPAGAAILARGAVQDTSSRRSSPGSEIPRKQRNVSRPIGELTPVLEWQWGAIFATALAMTGALLLTLPIALVYMWTKPAHESDPSVMHSSIILAPTIAGILIVIQGSLAMAFSRWHSAWRVWRPPSAFATR
jgi:hypothetical protein